MINILFSVFIRLWWILRFPKKDSISPKNYIPTNSTDRIVYLNQINCEYAVEAHGPGLIEPQTGWFFRGRTILAESYPYWTNVSFGWPPLPSLKGALNPFKKKTQIETTISLHYGWDNYYHFFIDTLPQIKYWQVHGNTQAVWVIPEKMKKSPFVQDYLSLDNFLEGRNVYFQQADEYINVKDRAFFLKRSRFKSRELNDVLRMLKENIQFQKGDEKIFLTRSENRSLVNRAEIEAIANSLNFRVIDTQRMSLIEQIQLFSKTRYLVGIHGAGLTNMIFRQGHPLSLLEIFPANKRPAHYWHLTIDFGYHYSYVCGRDMAENECFFLDPFLFEMAMKRMLDSDPNDRL